jgi:hypothetical protein
VGADDKVTAQTLMAAFARLAILYAWEVGEISEGAAAAMAGVDRLTLRDWRAEAVGCARRQWEDWRAAHPHEAVGWEVSRQ